MGFRNRVTNWFLRDHITAMEETVRIMELAYRRGPYAISEADLLQMLSEADSYLIDYVLRQRNYTLMSRAQREFDESDRLRLVDEAWYMYNRDVQAKNAVRMWTDFGFGQSIEVVPRDTRMKDVWDEFWSANRNAPVLKQRRIQNLSRDLINDGELFFIFYGSNIDGKTTIRTMSTKDVIRIVYKKNDPSVPLYYVRRSKTNSEIWYPDWAASKADLKSVTIPLHAKTAEQYQKVITVDGKETPVTSVRVLHGAFDEYKGRGWPILSLAYRWCRVVEQFLNDRAAVARRVAMFVDEIVHAGGSRAQSALEARFASALNSANYSDTNPPPAPASNLIHNKAMDVRRRPLTTGAGDALNDGKMFGGQVSAGTGVPLHWMGMPQAIPNRATATKMERPWNEQLERYQTFFVDVFQDAAEIVGDNAGAEERAVDVKMQSPVDTSIDDITRGMAATTDGVNAGAVDIDKAVRANEAMLRLLLSELGIRDVDSLLEGETGQIEQPETGQEVISLIANKLARGQVTPAVVAQFLVEEYGTNGIHS